ncbi:hypothetical protein ABEF95_006559 [Exophiala dermatitidis]
MAGVPQKTLTWLYDVLKHEYRDPNRAYSDLAHVLARHPGLAPRTDVYTFENGASALLVHFKGTIPVTFRGNTYRFPISLWIPYAYPYEPPICYVTPTEEMMIRPGQHVGGDGKIYHPYLAQWRETWERSNIVDFLSILSDVFAKEPPVMARTPQQQQQQQQRPVQPPPPPVPPLPREVQQQQQQHPASSMHDARPPSVYDARPPSVPSGAAIPPPPPPKQPANGVSSPSPSPIESPVAYRSSGRYDAPPPLPQSPGLKASRTPQHYADGNVQQLTGGMNYLPQRTTSLRQSSVPLPPHQPAYEQQQLQQAYRNQPLRSGEQQQYPPGPQIQSPPPDQGYDRSRPAVNQYGQGQRQPPGPMSSAQYYPSGPSPFPPPAPLGQPQPQQHSHPQPQYTNQYGPPPPPSHPQQPPYDQQRQPTHPNPKPPRPPTPNLLDDPFDIPLPSTSRHPHTSAGLNNIPAPPIPRNPEREALLTHLSHLITQSLHAQISQSTAALGPLTSQNAALQTTFQTLSNEISNLQSLQATLKSNISLLQTSLAKSDSVISSARKRAQQNDIPKVDEMLMAPTVVARQLYDAACEERGIEAAILALQDAFVRGRLGADVWARRTRELAREEFKRRWLERKVAKGMGLDLGDRDGLDGATDVYGGGGPGSNVPSSTGTATGIGAGGAYELRAPLHA